MFVHTSLYHTAVSNITTPNPCSVSYEMLWIIKMQTALLIFIFLLRSVYQTEPWNMKEVKSPTGLYINRHYLQLTKTQSLFFLNSTVPNECQYQTERWLWHYRRTKTCNNSKTCVKRPQKIDKTKILMTNGNLMKVQSIAEYIPWSTLQYFWLALSDNWSSTPIFGFLWVAVLHRFYCILLFVNNDNDDAVLMLMVLFSLTWHQQLELIVEIDRILSLNRLWMSGGARQRPFFQDKWIYVSAYFSLQYSKKRYGPARVKIVHIQIYA